MSVTGTYRAWTSSQGPLLADLAMSTSICVWLFINIPSGWVVLILGGNITNPLSLLWVGPWLPPATALWQCVWPKHGSKNWDLLLLIFNNSFSFSTILCFSGHLLCFPGLRSSVLKFKWRQAFLTCNLIWWRVVVLSLFVSLCTLLFSFGSESYIS